MTPARGSGEVSGRPRARPDEPRWLDPELATLTQDRFSDPGWIFERKLDGERCLAFESGSGVRLMTRNQKEDTTTYPEITRALAAQRAGEFIIDGEIVAFAGSQTRFARLQQRLGVRHPGPDLTGFGALLLGYYDPDHALAYAGKVGTGFSQATLDRLHAMLAGLEQDRPTFGRGRLPRSGVHWVQPRLVAEVGFSEWTTDGELRHPRFQGLRDDKDPADVVREIPQDIAQ